LKILLDNVNLSSSSGPNSFGKRLKRELENTGHVVGDLPDHDVQLSFITATKKIAPLALRLDGIYFNTRQDWALNNQPIKNSFNFSDLVIYQSQFNKKLTESYFGVHKNSVVINNGTCIDLIKSKNPIESNILDKFSEVWTCSASWRPHKRLKENINYFLHKSPHDACLVVAGENPDYMIDHPRVIYSGHMTWENCISLYRRSKFFLHLSFLDHCPNVVVDARASGCNIIVASSGGTREIAGPDAIVVQDFEWDLKPLDLYSPPPLNIDKTFRNGLESNIDIRDVAGRYADNLSLICGEK